ncbi:unnamed protein product [Heterobilharzia americana]|nr:unnamed protein product [Heterobilharzia americana]
MTETQLFKVFARHSLVPISPKVGSFGSRKREKYRCSGHEGGIYATWTHTQTGFCWGLWFLKQTVNYSTSMNITILFAAYLRYFSRI